MKLLEAYDTMNTILIDESVYNTFPTLKNVKLNNYEKQMLHCLIDPKNINVKFDDICGYENAKKEFEFCFEMFRCKPKSNLLTIPNGIILYGPPGTGKTMFAKACASMKGFSFLNVSPSSFENQYYGESIKLLKACFDLADKVKPTIIFLDEMDGFLSKRSQLDQHHINSLKTTFLSLMDGFIEKNENILVIGATNCIDFIDDAVKRRMNTQIHLNLPSIDEIKDLCKKLLKNESLSNDFNFDSIATQCYDKKMSGSYVKDILKKHAKLRYINNMTTEWNSNEIKI